MMRIITGEYRGRKIEAPRGMETRPTSDMMKESMFNILMNRVRGTVCMDLFSGTGNLGLEAISRGAVKCYFCDNRRESIKFIKKNIQTCGAEERATVVAGDWMKCLTRAIEPVDIIFIDPPYESGVYENVLEKIDEMEVLDDDGVIVCEHMKRQVLPEEIGSFEIAKQRKYGKKFLTFYEKKKEQI